MKRRALCYVIFIASFSSTTWAQIVNIPDTNFKLALIGNPAINTNGDAEIQVAEAVAFTGEIQVDDLGISDLEGIQAFIAITYLNCSENGLTFLDISQNVALTDLLCSGNDLTNLNVSNNVLLTQLDIGANLQITNLDVSSNTALKKLYCQNLNLNHLDVSSNTALEILACSDNQLSSLELSNNTALHTLFCHYNQIQDLDVSNNLALSFLQCSFNQLPSIDFTNNYALTKLYCNNNQLGSLDLSNCPNLTVLECFSNQLSTLNIQNGNNTSLVDFQTYFNPLLSCIQVDDVVYANQLWNNPGAIDTWANFSENCGISGINTSYQNHTFDVFPNPTKDLLHIKGLSENLDGEMSIYNPLGQLMFTSNSSKEINVASLANGWYILKLTQGEKTYTVKFIKE